MDFKKIILYLVAAVLGVTLWNQWMRDHPPAAVKQAEQAQQQAANASASTANGTPATFTPAANAGTSTAAKASTQTFTPKSGSDHRISGKTIEVKTDLFDLEISENGGSIVEAKLNKYNVSVKNKTPITLLNNTGHSFYVVQSGLTGIKQPVQYTAKNSVYKMELGQNQLTVELSGRTKNGLEVNKIYTFARDKYRINLTYQVKNAAAKPWQGSMFNQITKLAGSSGHWLGSRGYKGAAISSPSERYEKLKFKSLEEKDVSRNIKGGWIAMQDHYFLSTWVPNQKETNHYYSHTVNAPYGDDKIYTVGYVTPAQTAATGETVTFKSSAYVGPEIAKRLSKLADGLSLTIDYGWLWPISKLIFWVLSFIESLIGNWGWSIVLVTILIKLLFYALSEKSFKSMAKMRDVAPRIQALKERHGDDKQALSRATMELYKKEKVNPMGGCLPMIIQIPVFIALYYVLFESVQLRQAPFIFWIHDLSVKDPYYILPILMGISMFIQQKLTPTPMDSQQAKMMMALPVVFTIFFATFPAGLVLYWLVNNVVQSLHQWWAIKRHEKSKLKQRPKR